MDNKRIGNMILNYRKEKGLTQLQLAETLGVSDKAVSKWERGQGCPDISLIVKIAELLEVNVDNMLQGSVEKKEPERGNMKNLKYYVCSECGNIIVGMGDAEISCCGKKINPSEVVKEDEKHRINVESIEDEWFFTTDHPMEKEHYITFLAFMNGDRVQIIKQYPEWDMQTRINKYGHGKLVWGCNKHGLFYKLI